MEIRKCTKCLAQLPSSSFGKSPHSRDGLNNHCKSCVRQAAIKYRQSHPELVRDKNKEKYHRNIQYHIEYCQKNRDLVKTSKDKHYEKSRDNLSDHYVLQLLTNYTNLKVSQIPEELVKLKRVQLQIMRKLKESNK